MAAVDACMDNPDYLAFAHGHMRNRKQLAHELECAPETGASQILLAAYRKWGTGCVDHIEGSCALCIMDIEQDTLLIARDRMGEQAVFFAISGEAVVFADHPDAILDSGIVEALMDREGVCEIFGLGPARTPGKTPLKGILSLLPGEMLLSRGGLIERKKYYTLETREHAETPAQTVMHVRELLEKSVNEYVDLHPASMLSGGLDSTALTAILCTRIRRADSFSVDYQDNSRDFVANAFRPEMDAPYIRLAARMLNTRHHDVVLTHRQLADTLSEAMQCRGFPGMADIDASLLLFAGEISKYSDCVISGECGDEVFGGYPWFRGEARLPDRTFPWSGSMRLRTSVLKKDVAEKVRLEQYAADALHASLDSYDVSSADGEDEKNRFKLQRLCFDYFMPNLQERAVKMCGGRELRVITPLCDDRLVEYVYNVPWNIKKLNGVEKGLYREAVRDLLPDKLRMRKKSPYPKTCSPEYTCIIRGLIREMLADAAAPIWQIADRESIEKIAESELDPAATPWYGQLMAGAQMLAYLLQVNQWMQARGVRVEL